MVIAPVNVHRRKHVLPDGRRRQGECGLGLEEVRHEENYAAGHQGSLSKSCQDIAGMVLVVRHTGQSCVKGHHDQGELQKGPEQAGPSPSESGLQVQHQIQHSVHGEGGMAREEGLPGFLDFAVFASASVVLNIAHGAVDLTEIRVADIQEVRTQAPYGDLGNVCEGLADGAAEEEAAHLLVEGCHVGILNRRAGLLLQVIDAVEFPCDDREDGNNNPHSSEHSVVDCLPSFLWILDALVVAVKAPVVRLDGARLDDDERQAGHEEAEEVQADEQHPLAASLPRVVVERRAAAVLALCDDRLVVLVVLHGAGQDARRQQPHTQTPGSPPGRGCSGRGGRMRPRCPLPKAGGGAFCSPWGSSAFPVSTLNRSKVQGEKSQLLEGKVLQRCAACNASWRVCAQTSEWAARALGHLPPRLVA